MDSSSNSIDAERPTFHIYITDNRCTGDSAPACAACVCVCAGLLMDLKEEASGVIADTVWNFE